MAYVSDVFNASMALMDELDSSGQAQTRDTKEYEHRTPGIVNMMIAELNLLGGNRDNWVPTESLEDFVAVDNTYALGVMIYGLAANLLVDENPTAASFYQSRYEELRTLYLSRHAADREDIEDVYGIGAAYNDAGRW